MPLPEKYRRQLIATAEAAERESRWDWLRHFARTFAEVTIAVLLGMFLIGLAFHTFDYELGMVYWWAGFIVWFGGVSFALLGAHRRAVERGDV